MEHHETRPFGFWTACAMVVGGVIGAGIFVMPSQLAPYGWTGVAAWIVGGLGAVAIGLVLSSVAAARPQEPGLIAVIGEVLGPVWGVLVGWGAWVSYWCANAYIALTAARYAGAFWPPLADTPFHQALTASAVILALTWLNLHNLRTSGRFQVVTTVLKLLPLVAVMLILVQLTVADPSALVRQPHPPFVGAELFTATTLAYGAIIGFESAAVGAQRVRNPGRNVPRATIAGILLSCLIYLAVSTTIVFTMPVAEVAASNAPIAMFIGSHWGSGAALAVAGFAVISTVGCLNVWVLLQGEVPLALARAKLLPDWIGRTNRHDIAAIPMITASALSVALLFAASWRNGAAIMDFMIRLTAVSGIWVYVFACVTALVLGVSRILAVMGLLVCAGVFYGGGAEPFVLSVVLSVVALPLYLLARRGMVRTAGSSAAAAGLPG